MSDFKKLKVWRKAHALALNVHRVATRIRGADNASLRSQLLRAAMSVPTNIVEGTGQKSGREFGRFLDIALKSTSEIEYHLFIARGIDVINSHPFCCSQIPDQPRCQVTTRTRSVAVLQESVIE